MYFVYDTETSGLPRKRKTSYKDNDAYSTCRIVSIAWVVLDAKYEIMTSKYYVVKPSSESIPFSAASIAIHGISNELAQETGIMFNDVVTALTNDIKCCKTLVAHNISFDFGVLLHELNLGGYDSVIHHIFNMNRICTMHEGKKVLGLKKFPRLAELYALLFDGDQFEKAHHALADTEACVKCFIKMNL